ncbi:MAG: right-handed parallel beta-helix repeat-containing protein [Lentisphaeria bacterium]|nr:right-handed parallel beta-helix repeat-containing protein [Lentisphaeria bacterium]
MRVRGSVLAVLAAASLCLPLNAKDIYVSLATGKNKNAGTKEAPYKNLWKALNVAQIGDVIHVAEGNYPGRMKGGWFKMEKPVSIFGGYSSDFTQRDPLKYKTMFQPKNENNDKKVGTQGLLHLEFDKNPMKAPKGFNIVIDGLIFDDGFASSYHAVKGKPAGFDTGMWLEGPAKNKADKFPSANRYSISSATASRGDGNLTIRNCTFVNGSNYAVNLNWYKGNITIVNNVFCNNRMLSVNVSCSNGSGKINWECAYNTILFTWSRLNDLADMGFAIRNNENCNANIHNNIIGLNVLTGFDNTKGNPKKKTTKLDNNIFFLNRESDVQMTMSPSVVKVRVDSFEDLEEVDGIESIDGNIDLKDPKIFAGRINAQYLNAFLSMKYSEKTKLDPGKCNALRSVLGLPLQGTITTTCDMYANRYPQEDALKLFGAVTEYGAQMPK